MNTVAYIKNEISKPNKWFNKFFSFGIVGLFILVCFVLSCKKEVPFTKLSGSVFGTTYNIQYASKINYQLEIDSLFNAVNQSLSTYLPNSLIADINSNKITKVDGHFIAVLKASEVIYTETNGIFDPTVGNLVNAWKFGADKKTFKTDSLVIDSLMQFVGFSKLKLNGNIIDKPPGTYLEFNAIAKGYGIDVIAEFLESNGVMNYSIDIGGDLRARGFNTIKNKAWTMGIEDPNFDGSRSYSKVISLHNKGMATSGTYRKYKIDENGNRYSHIIDAKTGYPSKTNILSVSVIAENAMMADGYATAFQAMGIDKITRFLNNHKELQVYIIYLTADNRLKTLALNGFPE